MPRPETAHWLDDSIIYQLFVGRWPEASLLKHPGQVFTKLTQTDFSKLKQAGINCIYLLGVFDNTGPIIVGQEEGNDLNLTPNRLPSPFALSNHHDTNPALGSVTDLKNLISYLHQQDFNVVLDFVANHTGTTHHWLTNHPDYYHQKDGSPTKEFSGDVCKLNYNNPQVRKEMTSTLRTLAGWGVDGVRCDMAHLVPLDFWSAAIQEIRSTHPGFAFIAEAYSTISPVDMSFVNPLLKAGFDSVYHGPLHKNLIQAIEYQHTDFLAGHLNFILGHFHHFLINYFANHDDKSPHSMLSHLEALLALTLFLEGTPLIYNGILNGFTRRLAHHYYDELEERFLETKNIPANLSKLLQLRLKLSPKISAVLEKNKLLACQLEVEGSQAILILNFTNKPQAIPKLASKNSGQLHQLTSHDPLPPGQAEIFFI